MLWANVLPLLIGYLYISIRDETEAPKEYRCPSMIGCPQHAADNTSQVCRVVLCVCVCVSVCVCVFDWMPSACG